VPYKSYTAAEDLIFFVGIPLAVIGLVFALVYIAGARSAKRYRPGRPYSYAPVWFLARPESDGPEAQPKAEITAGSGEDPAGSTHAGVTGGASDRW
jgi:hypothetical protein